MRTQRKQSNKMETEPHTKFNFSKRHHATGCAASRWSGERFISVFVHGSDSIVFRVPCAVCGEETRSVIYQMHENAHNNNGSRLRTDQRSERTRKCEREREKGNSPVTCLLARRIHPLGVYFSFSRLVCECIDTILTLASHKPAPSWNDHMHTHSTHPCSTVLSAIKKMRTSEQFIEKSEHKVNKVAAAALEKCVRTC